MTIQQFLAGEVTCPCVQCSYWVEEPCALAQLREEVRRLVEENQQGLKHVGVWCSVSDCWCRYSYEKGRR